MAPKKLSDAELVERCRLVEEYGDCSKAARATGLDRSALQKSLQEAVARGLTAKSTGPGELERLQTKLKLAQREIEATKRHNESAEQVRTEIYNLAAMTPDPPKWLITAPKVGISGVPMTIWSDFHWGETVRKEEVGGVNEFNRKIARERFRMLVQSTIELAKHHMVKPKYPGIVVCLGGDLITGNLHDLAESNDGYVQQSILEVQEMLEWGLGQMADAFGQVFVPCVVGNHGRTTLKPKTKGRVYESFEWNIYCQLEKYFRNDRRIQFLIPGETDAYFKVHGHRFLLTHGDTLGVKGGDGIIGAIGPIARGATKVGRSEAQIGRDFDTLLMGHYHTYIPRGDAVPVIVNGALKGYDEYARLMLRVPYSRPSQALWFVHPKYGITAQWCIYLDKKRKSEDSSTWLSFQKRNK